MRWRSRLSDLRLVLVVTTLGQATGAVALLALALRLRGSSSAWAVAGLFLVAMVPAVALAPAIGLLLDRLETVRLLRLLALAAAGLDLGLAWAPGTVLVLVLAALLAVETATSSPGMLAIAGALDEGSGGEGVRPLTLVQVAQWTGTTAGAVGGGALVALLGTRVPLLLDSGASLLVAGALAGIGAERAPARPRPASGWADGIWAGFRLFWGDPLLRRLAGPVAIVIAGVNAVVVVEVYLATITFGSGATGYGALTAVWAAGIVVGALAVPRLGRFDPLLVTASGAALAALGLVGTAASPDLALALVPYFAAGIGNGLEINSARVLVQLRAPAAVRGRAFAAYLALGTGAAALGTAAGGGLLALTSPRGAVLLAAAPVGLAALWLGGLAGGAGGGGPGPAPWAAPPEGGRTVGSRRRPPSRPGAALEPVVEGAQGAAGRHRVPPAGSRVVAGAPGRPASGGRIASGRRAHPRSGPGCGGCGGHGAIWHPGAPARGCGHTHP